MALGAMPVLNAFKKRLDPRLYNGASFLGLRGIVVKSHGGADTVAFHHAIQVAIEEARSGVDGRRARRVDDHAVAAQTVLLQVTRPVCTAGRAEHADEQLAQVLRAVERVHGHGRRGERRVRGQDRGHDVRHGVRERRRVVGRVVLAAATSGGVRKVRQIDREADCVRRDVLLPGQGRHVALVHELEPTF